MKRPIPIGIEFYKEMIDKSYYYVDKTLFIKELLDRQGKVNLFTRPRRFGKTLALTMIKTFFEDEYDWYGKQVDNRHYFEGMKIAAAGEAYMRYQGKYPVIFLTLKSAKQRDFQIAYEMLQQQVMYEYNRHRYVLGSELLTEKERERFLRIESGDAKESEYAGSLGFLSKCLEKFHGKKTVILLDEYDVPLENSYFSGFYEEMAGFIRSFFESALKTNDSLEFAVVTGCLRISKESIFTGFNNLQIMSILSTNYAEYFGFAPQEVEDMLAFYGLSEKLPEAKEWYDGYIFGEREVYNPWSILNYVSAAESNRDTFPRPYWSNTSSNSIVRELIDMADQGVRREIEELIAGDVIEKVVHEDITYDEVYESQDNLWNFLFFTGYLKKLGERKERENIYLKMAIPNTEITYIYRNSILQWFDEQVKKKDMRPLVLAIENGDCEAFGDFISQQLLETISFFDYAESYYHGFMAGLLKYAQGYLIMSNRENGNGRSDLVMRTPSLRGRAIIMELKVADKFERMEQACDAALKQIEDRQYGRDLESEGYRNILKYGIAFYKKECLVKCAEKGV